MRRLPSRWLFLAAFGLALAIAAPAGLAIGSGAVGSAAPSGKFIFDEEMGDALPNHAGKVEVTVDCEGPSTCRGVVKILARGKTLTELGARPLAAKFVRLGRGGDGDRIMALRPAARQQLAKGPLTVTVRVEVQGRPARTKAALIAILPRVKAPKETVGSVRTLSGATATFHRWAWVIGATGGYAPVEDFKCPDGSFVEKGRQFAGRSEGHIEVTVESSGNVGYSAFDKAHTQRDTYEPHSYATALMRGWPSGGFFSNSFWSTPGHRARVVLKTWCTGDRNVALVPEGNEYRFFPWKN